MAKKHFGGLTDWEPMFETAISGISGQRMVVRGYDLIDLLNDSTFEEIAFLLLYSRWPDPEEVTEIQFRLESEQNLLPRKVQELLQIYSGNENPLNVAMTCFSAIAAQSDHVTFNKEEDLNTQAISAIAIYSSILAAHIRKRRGAAKLPPKLMGLDHASQFIYSCFGHCDPLKARVLNQCMVASAEASFASSTFAARVIASTRSDFFSALCGVIATWKGFRHGGASEFAYTQLEELAKSGDHPEEFYQSSRHSQSLFFGFGHRFYKSGEDPRIFFAESLSRFAYEKWGGRLYPSAVAAAQYFKSKGRFANPDLYLASFCDSLGFTASETPAIAFLGRIAGISAHLIEEYGPERPMMAPRSAYTGPGLREALAPQRA